MSARLPSTGPASERDAANDRAMYLALAGTIADQAQAIKDGTVIGPVWSAVKRLRDNADMLLAWTPDHRVAGSEGEG